MPLNDPKPARVWLRPGCVAMSCAALLILFVGFLVPFGSHSDYRGMETRAVNNAWEVIATLRTHQPSPFPAEASSNQILRTLFQCGYVEDERIFSEWMSPYQPDNDIGEPPDFARALEPGELHWCLFSETLDNPSGNAPVVFDNPIDGAWPPKWNAAAERRPLPGRLLKGGKVIVAMSDGSINFWQTTPQPDGTALADPSMLDLVPSKRFHDIER